MIKLESVDFKVIQYDPYSNSPKDLEDALSDFGAQGYDIREVIHARNDGTCSYKDFGLVIFVLSKSNYKVKVEE
jgi:hypothetical protein